MKFPAFAMLLLPLLATSALAAPDGKRMAAIQKTLAQRCDTSDASLRYPIDITEYPAPSYRAVVTGQRTVTVKYRRLGWTGDCVDGMLDGEGTLSIETNTSGNNNYQDGVTRHVASGLLLKGQRVGPWRVEIMEMMAPDADMKRGHAKRMDIYDGKYMWADGVPPGVYNKEADGSFTLLELRTGGSTLAHTPSNFAAPVSAADVALFKQRAIALARGAAHSGAGPTFALPMLAGLMPAARIEKAAASDIAQSRSKSVAIVLTSGTPAALASLDQFQQFLQQKMQAEGDPRVRAAIQKLVDASAKRPLLDELATMLRKSFAKVGTAQDLAAFKASGYDYALIFDIGALIKPAEVFADCMDFHAGDSRTDAHLRLRPYLSFQSAYLLVDRQLKVVVSAPSSRIDIASASARFSPPEENAAARRAGDADMAFSSVANGIARTLRTSEIAGTAWPPQMLWALHYTLDSFAK